MAAGQHRFFPGAATSRSATRSTRSTTVGAAGERVPKCEVWVQRLPPRKLFAFVLRKDAEELVLCIFGKSLARKFRELARDMQIGYAVVFGESGDAKRV